MPPSNSFYLTPLRSCKCSGSSTVLLVHAKSQRLAAIRSTCKRRYNIPYDVLIDIIMYKCTSTELEDITDCDGATTSEMSVK